MHVSLDGYVSGPNGEMDWITVNEEIFDHIGKRVSQSDTALYGRVTYEMMENYWPAAGNNPAASKHEIEHSRWYKHVHKVVLSKTMNDATLTNTTVISDHLLDKIGELKQSLYGSGKDILIFGSPRATHSLIQRNLIDGYWLFVNPIILGHGVPLFADIKDKIKLNLLTTQAFNCGVIELNYTVNKH